MQSTSPTGRTLAPKEPSAGEREGAPLACKEPSAGEREGAPLACKEPSAGEREGAPLACKEPSAGEREGAPLACKERGARPLPLSVIHAEALYRPRPPVGYDDEGYPFEDSKVSESTKHDDVLSHFRNVAVALMLDQRVGTQGLRSTDRRTGSPPTLRQRGRPRVT